MKATNCWYERISKLGIGITLSIFGLGLVVIGLTIIPIFGLVLAIPVFMASGYFIKAHLNKECQIAE